MKKILFTIFLVLCLPLVTEASATRVSVKAGSEKINAVEGTLLLPSSVQIERITTGDSAVLLWIKSPEWNPAEHSISFSGISPGGFSGTASLFTLELSSGVATQTGGRLYGYRNDGKGTQLMLEYTFSSTVLAEDLERPEPFKLNFAKDENLFDGQYIVSFSAQDKNSGIDHYELATSWFLPPRVDAWQEATSPQVLPPIQTFKRIHIRATDKAGNDLTVSTAGPNWYFTLAFGLIIVVCLALFLRRSLSHFS